MKQSKTRSAGRLAWGGFKVLSRTWWNVIFSLLGIYAAVVACTMGEIAAWGG